MSKPNQKASLGFVLSLVAAMMWGMLPVTIKEILPVMDASTLVWYRFAVAGVVLFIYLYKTNSLPAISHRSGNIKILFLLAAMGLCSNYVLFAYSLNFVNGETSEAVIQLSTLFLIVGSVLIYAEPFVRRQKLGTVLIALGLVLFFNDRLGSLLDSASDERIGVLVVVLAAITWTVYALIQKRLLADYSPSQILLVIYVFSVVVLLPLASPLQVMELSAFQLLLLAFCCINTLVAYGAFAEAMNHWESSKVSAVLALAPLFTISSLSIVVAFFILTMRTPTG